MLVGGDGSVFAAVAEAYEVLSDQKRRSAYDAARLPTRHASTDAVDIVDLESLRRAFPHATIIVGSWVV
jgi:curved DNA-binding protein CbpA